MSKDVIGNQTIGCSVKSCRHNQGSYCALSRIQVQPCSGECSHTGNPADESLCGSYNAR